MTHNVLVSNKRIRRQRILKNFILTLLIVVFVLITFCISPFFIKELKINLVFVSGAKVLPEHKIESEIKKIMATKIFGVIPQDRIFFLPREKIISHLFEQFIRLNNVEIKREFPSMVWINVEERVPFATLCLPRPQAGGIDIKDCFFIDQTGFVFGSAPIFSSGVYLKFFDKRMTRSGEGEFLLNQETLQGLIDFSEQFDITEIYLKEDEIYELYTSEGWYLILSGEDDWDLVYNNFMTFSEEMLKDDVGDIDLRFNNKIFYKWKE
ncbi:cell division protein FtsQ/DivIB [Patescibacteria group bacterium]